MNQDTKELTVEESIQQVMQTLPPVIREYLAQEKYTPIARAIMAKYSMRIDQGGVLEREIMLLLMGVDDPSEFTRALSEEARLDQETVASIVQDVNTQIFGPLRQEEEKQSRQALVQQNKKPQSKMPIYTGPVAPLPPKAMMPSSTLGDVVRQVTAPKLLEDHEESHIEINKISQAPRPDVEAGMLPGAMPPVPAPTLPKSIPPAPFVPKPPIITEYSTDPYREPIDDGKVA